MRRVLVAGVLLGSLATAIPAWAQSQDECAVVGGRDCDEEAETGTTIDFTTRVVVYDGEGGDEGAVRELSCAAGEAEVIYSAVINQPGQENKTNYSGGSCVDENSIPLGGAFDTQAVANTVTLPEVAVHYNPHADFFLANLPVWFWHTGSTTHDQQNVGLTIGGISVAGDFVGRISQFCWTVDDNRVDVTATEVVPYAKACGRDSSGTTYVSSRQGVDTEEGNAAGHTFETRGYDTIITHEVVWSGTFTITDGPQGLGEGTVLQLAPIIRRAQVSVPVRQLIPYPVPNPANS